MRTMGLDVGTRTVGIAMADELGLTAQALITLQRKNLKTDIGEIAKLIEKNNVTVVVIGLPLNMNGSEGPRAEASRNFGAALRKESDVLISYWDERLTTAEAERVLIAGNVSRERRKKVIDQLAACIILQSWLDAHRANTLDNDPD
jgi:putative Holliday junction resolvase